MRTDSSQALTHARVLNFLILEWMYEIISNERNKIDVDKFDYIRRDPFMASFKTAGYECAILINGARVMENQICYPSKSANHVYDLFISRQNLHK